MVTPASTERRLGHSAGIGDMWPYSVCEVKRFAVDDAGRERPGPSRVAEDGERKDSSPSPNVDALSTSAGGVCWTI